MKYDYILLVKQNLLSNLKLLMSPEQNTSAKPKKSNKLWIFAGIVVALITVVLLNFTLAVETYCYVFKSAHFNSGDKVYASQRFFDIKQVNSIAALRLIRPLTAKEIDNDMSILDEEKRRTLKQSLNSSLKPYVTLINISFSKEAMQKLGTTVLGTYLDKTLIDVKKIPGIDEGKAILYRIKPDMKNVNISPMFDRLPENYTLADSLYYIDPLMAGKQETTLAKK